MAVFETSVELACSPETAFDFLIQPANSRLVSPPSLMLVFDEAPERLSLGARTQYRVQTHGVVRSAIHEVTEWDPPRKFVERQIDGTLGALEHAHLFEPTSQGVRVTDRITFSPPSGLLKFLVNEKKIREAFEEGFEYRHHELIKRFGTPAGAT